MKTRVVSWSERQRNPGIPQDHAEAIYATVIEAILGRESMCDSVRGLLHRGYVRYMVGYSRLKGSKSREIIRAEVPLCFRVHWNWLSPGLCGSTGQHETPVLSEKSYPFLHMSGSC